MKRTRLSRLAWAVAAMVSVLVVACDEDLLQDATFRAWCGDGLCSWNVESGSVRKAPTWHPNDYGVELVDTPTVLSQETGSSSSKCITFTTVADIDPAAQVTIGLDFNRDGSIEVEQPVAASGFHQAKNQITAPVAYDGIRFVISKKGQGHAVLAEIRAVGSLDGCTAPALKLSDLPLGTTCSLTGDGDECRSGICCQGLCAECCDIEPASLCEDGGTCKSRVTVSVKDTFGPAMPKQCDPGARDHAPSEECVAASDCASGVCVGARVLGVGTEAVDGGLPACDPVLDDPPNSDQCVVVNVRGGRCQ